MIELIRLRRRPRQRAETPRHFGVQAGSGGRVDECEEDNPPKPCLQEGMLRRIPPENTEVPRLRAEALQRPGTGFARGAP
jgi:hypothetical protein